MVNVSVLLRISLLAPLSFPKEQKSHYLISCHICIKVC